MARSYDNIKFGVGKEVDFSKGSSYHVEGLLLMGMPCVALLKYYFITEIFGIVTNFETGYAKDHFITCDHRVKTMHFKK